jgi:hypothetical protein
VSERTHKNQMILPLGLNRSFFVWADTVPNRPLGHSDIERYDNEVACDLSRR